MKRNQLKYWLFLIALFAGAIALTSCNHDNQDKSDLTDYEPPSFGECVTYIENENGSVRLTDMVGFAFEFDVVLKRDFTDLNFEIPIYSDNDGSLVTLSTSEMGYQKPVIYVDGEQRDSLPTTQGSYKIRLDISHMTTRGYTIGNTLTALGFGKIDLICLY